MKKMLNNSADSTLMMDVWLKENNPWKMQRCLHHARELECTGNVHTSALKQMKNALQHLTVFQITLPKQHHKYLHNK